MKHFRLTLFLALALTALLALSVSAAETPTAQLTVSQNAGQCTVSVSASAPIGSIQFTLPSGTSATVKTAGYSASSGSDSTYAYVGFANQKFVAAGTDSGVIETEILTFPSEDPISAGDITDVEIGGLDGETIFDTDVVVEGGTATIEVSVACQTDHGSATSVSVMQNGSEVASANVVDGKLELEGLADGTYQFAFSRADHVSRTYNVTISGGVPTAPINVELNLIGDVTGDGKVNSTDYRQVLNHASRSQTLTGYAFDCGDVNGDGKVNSTDYRLILSHASKSQLLW